MRGGADRLAATLAATRARSAAVALAVAAAGCGARGQAARLPGPAIGTRDTGAGRPPLAVLARQGDARGALAVAVTTAGLAPERGAMAAVSLAALVEARLAARGVESTAVGGWDGWRLRALVASPADAARVVEAVRAALLEPVATDEPAVAAAARKAASLGRRPLPDAALAEVARCTGEAYAAGDLTAPTVADLEGWRQQAHGLGRVAIAVVGEAALADAAARALGSAPSWPRAVAVPSLPWPPAHGPSTVYAASEIPPGSARIVVTARTAAPERAVAAAPALGDPQGPLASRLAALPAPARVRSVVATAHVDGGCLAATIDLSARDLASDATARIATAAALVRQEVAVEMADASTPPDLGGELTRRAADPRDAAERAAWWSLARSVDVEDDPRIGLTVGVAAPRDASAAMTPEAMIGVLRAEIDRATVAWHAPVLDAKTFVERGQGEVWVLVGSPCGTWSESAGDAGAGAAVALAAASRAADAARDAQADPFVSADGIGILVHGPARPGESPQAHARRLADVAARAFAADELEPARIAEARTVLLARAAQTEARTFSSVAGALAPGHPSWVDPEGTSFGLGSISDDSVAVRAAAVRAGPLRVAVVADADAAQAEAAVRAADRWVARGPGESRACPATAAAAAPRPGTYSVDLRGGALSEALLALPLPAGDPGARAAAGWIAAALEGADGLLAHTLGADGHGSVAAAPLARGWSAAVVGSPQAQALMLRVTGPDSSLDDAVAQVRALLDRLRHGALREEDRTRASAALGREHLAAALDPRARAIALWRGEAPSSTTPPVAPSLDDLRSFAASTLRDETLIIAAARPPHAPPDKPEKTSAR